jgi:8-amino-7-oxononanoate synthase
MDSVNSDLEEYARRRLKLAGFSVIGYDHPYFAPLDRLRSDFRSRGDTLVSFANYDYLGLSEDARIHKAATQAIAEFGVGVGGSRLVGGERTCHRALEYDLAAFIGVDDTIAMVSGYGTNLSLVGHLLTKGDMILVDELAHNSIVMGSRLSRATIVEFPHNDTARLEEILKEKRSHFRRVLIVIEGLYSMDGDVPDLPKFLDLRDRYDAWLMIDEAHSIGVLGKTGRGVTEHFGLDMSNVDLVVGTMSKAFVSCGGFIGGKQVVIDWLRFTLPGFVYSVGLTPSIAATVREALDIISRETWRVAKLRENSRYFAERARALGFNIGDAISEGIIPIIFDTSEKAMLAARALLRVGYYVPPIVQLGVPKNKPRLRFFFNASHTKAQIDGVLEALVATMDPSRLRANFSSKAHLHVPVVATASNVVRLPGTDIDPDISPKRKRAASLPVVPPQSKSFP